MRSQWSYDFSGESSPKLFAVPTTIIKGDSLQKRRQITFVPSFKKICKPFLNSNVDLYITMEKMKTYSGYQDGLVLFHGRILPYSSSKQQSFLIKIPKLLKQSLDNISFVNKFQCNCLSKDKTIFTRRIADDRDYRDYSSCNQGPILYNIILNTGLKIQL